MVCKAVIGSSQIALLLMHQNGCLPLAAHTLAFNVIFPRENKNNRCHTKHFQKRYQTCYDEVQFIALYFFFPLCFRVSSANYWAQNFILNGRSTNTLSIAHANSSTNNAWMWKRLTRPRESKADNVFSSADRLFFVYQVLYPNIFHSFFHEYASIVLTEVLQSSAFPVP